MSSKEIKQEPTLHSTVLEWLNNNNYTLSNILKWKNIPIHMGITIFYDDERMILTGGFRCHQSDNFNVNECNGLIIGLDKDSGKLRVLVYPMPYLNNKISEKKLTYPKEEYDVFHAEDGTIFNLYYFNDRWVISTVRGLDMNKIEKYGVSYVDMIDHCSNEVLGYSWDELTTKLSKSKCYTFGFKHENMHKFIPSKLNGKANHLWFVRSVNTKTGVVSTELKIRNFPSQRRVELDSIDINELKKRAEESYKKYINININIDDTNNNTNNDPNITRDTVIDNKSELDDFCLYGYIIRPKKHSYNKSSLLIESSLMTEIKNILYNDEYINSLQNNIQESMIYGKAEMFGEAHKFLQLFPEKKKIINVMSNFNSYIKGLVRKKLTEKTHNDTISDTEDVKDIQYICLCKNNKKITVTTKCEKCESKFNSITSDICTYIKDVSDLSDEPNHIDETIKQTFMDIETFNLLTLMGGFYMEIVKKLKS